MAVGALFDVISAEVRPSGALAGEVGVRAFRELVLPMFTLVPADAATLPPARAEWARTTGRTALTALERAFCSSYAQLSSILDEVMALLVRCLQQRHVGKLAHTAAEALLHLVKETGSTQETWRRSCRAH